MMTMSTQKRMFHSTVTPWNAVVAALILSTVSPRRGVIPMGHALALHLDDTERFHHVGHIDLVTR